MRSQRIGIVDALESRPLAWSFLRREYGDLFSPSLHTPERIAELLGRDELELGLLPSIELHRLTGLKVVPGVCLAGRGSGIRALLQLATPIHRVRSVAVKRGASASVALMRIVLREVFELEPKVVAEHEPLGSGCDARLVVGDETLRLEPADLESSIDLGERWHRLTGRPFVFAVWAVRGGVRLPGLQVYFERSLRDGLAALDQLVREAAAEWGFETERARRYLERDLEYVLGEEQVAGLEEFLARAHAFGLSPGPRPLELWTE